MNLRVYPAILNNSRKLRRPSVPAVAHSIQGDRSCDNHLVKQSPSLKNNYQFAMETLQSKQTIHLDQTDREMLLRQQAMDKAQQGNLTEAVDLFTQLIQFNPHSASNYNNRGLLHFQNGKLQRALADYNRALLLNPRLAKVYNNRANCYVALGDLETAIADYEMAIDLDPTNIRARLNLGITLRQAELYDSAIESFDLALQFTQFLQTTDTVNVSSALEGHLYAERGRTSHLMGDWNYAIADYYRALARLPLGNSTDISHRLRTQVRWFLNELLSPLESE